MSHELINKMLRTAIHESTDDGTRANALAKLRQLIGDNDFEIATFVAGSETPLSKAKAAEAEAVLEAHRLTDRIIRVENALKRVLNSLKGRIVTDYTGIEGEGTAVDQQFANRALEWMVEQMLEAGLGGITKSAMMAMVTLRNHKKSISKRWSELVTKGYGFALDDQTMVSVNFADEYPTQWAEHERLRHIATATGKTKMRVLLDDANNLTTIVALNRKTETV
jgi:hypothetical protein